MFKCLCPNRFLVVGAFYKEKALVGPSFTALVPRSGQHGRDIAPLYTMDQDQTGVLARHRDKMLESFNSQQVKQADMSAMIDDDSQYSEKVPSTSFV